MKECICVFSVVISKLFFEIFFLTIADIVGGWGERYSYICSLLSRRPFTTISLSPWQIFRYVPFLVPPVQMLASRTCHATYTESNPPHFYRVRKIRSEFQSKSFSL